MADIKVDKIIYSARKTISIVISDGKVVVHAPTRLSMARIMAFVDKKSNWINKKLAEAKKNSYPVLDVKTNELIPVFDKIYTIELTDGCRVKFNGDKLFVPENSSKDKLKRFLISTLKKFISSEVDRLSNTYGYNFKSIKINSARTRWGSCSYDNNLNFSFVLALCPSEVVRYVIVHELSHTKVKNHSTKFYEEVAKVLPNYKLEECWLKTNKSIMHML